MTLPPNACLTLTHNESVLLEINKLKLGAESSADAVVERAEVWTRNVVLHVARVEVVGEIKDFEADSDSYLFASVSGRDNAHRGHGDLQTLRHL